MILSKRRFCQHGPHPKIDITHFDTIIWGARVPSAAVICSNIRKSANIAINIHDFSFLYCLSLKSQIQIFLIENIIIPVPVLLGRNVFISIPIYPLMTFLKMSVQMSTRIALCPHVSLNDLCGCITCM